MTEYTPVTDNKNEMNIELPIINALKNNKELFYHLLIEKWAKQTLEAIKNSISDNATKENFTYSCTVSPNIIPQEYTDLSRSNELFSKEVKERRLRRIFDPLAKFSRFKKEKVKTGFFKYNKRYRSYFSLSLDPIAEKAVNTLVELAKKEDITIIEITAPICGKEIADIRMCFTVYGENSEELYELVAHDEPVKALDITSCDWLDIRYKVNY